jgi:hypothetical protein
VRVISWPYHGFQLEQRTDGCIGRSVLIGGRRFRKCVAFYRALPLVAVRGVEIGLQEGRDGWSGWAAATWPAGSLGRNPWSGDGESRAQNTAVIARTAL